MIKLQKEQTELRTALCFTRQDSLRKTSTALIFKEAAQEAAEFERAWAAENEAGQLQALKDNGMEVIENPDVESFRAAVKPVYDKYPQYAEYLSRIQDALAE